MRKSLLVAFLSALILGGAGTGQADVMIKTFKVPDGAHPHDVAPGMDGVVWYTAQHQGALGRLDPKTGAVKHIPLGRGSSPHGVIVSADGAAWVTDSGLNAIVRVDHHSHEVKVYPLPKDRSYANLNTPAFDGQGRVWFTGQNGIYGRLDPKTGDMRVFDAPRGAGPYGITATPDGTVYYASLAGNHIARVDPETGKATVVEPPTKGQGARRVWSDSRGRVWVSEWYSGQVSVFDPKTGAWRAWKLPGDDPRAYAVYVDELDKVWLSDFGANAMVRFDPATQTFDVFKSPRRGAAVRQIHGRAGEVWAPESGTDTVVLYKTR